MFYLVAASLTLFLIIMSAKIDDEQLRDLGLEPYPKKEKE